MYHKSGFSSINIIVCIIPVIIYLILAIFENNINTTPFFVVLIISLILFIVIFCSYFTTYYKIENEYLIISMLFYKTKIKITEIKKITYSDSIIKTNIYKPGFHHKGIEIIYKNYNDIYISPTNRELLIEQLVNINTKIETIKK